MGRTGKPVSQHKRDGTYHATKHGKGALPVEMPDMPPDLKPLAQAVWKHYGQLLVDAGLMAKLDGLPFRLLCEAEAMRLEAQDAVHETGHVLKGSKGPIMNPSVRIFDGMMKFVLTTGLKFGMTPVGRRGLDLQSKPETDDTTARILGFKIA